MELKHKGPLGVMFSDISLKSVGVEYEATFWYATSKDSSPGIVMIPAANLITIKKEVEHYVGVETEATQYAINT